MTKVTYYRFVHRCGRCSRPVSSYVEKEQPFSQSETGWCPYCQQYTILQVEPGVVEEVIDE